jgi:hypothetical protein
MMTWGSTLGRIDLATSGYRQRSEIGAAGWSVGGNVAEQHTIIVVVQQNPIDRPWGQDLWDGHAMLHRKNAPQHRAGGDRGSLDVAALRVHALRPPADASSTPASYRAPSLRGEDHESSPAARRRVVVRRL